MTKLQSVSTSYMSRMYLKARNQAVASQIEAVDLRGALAVHEYYLDAHSCVTFRFYKYTSTCTVAEAGHTSPTSKDVVYRSEAKATMGQVLPPKSAGSVCTDCVRVAHCGANNGHVTVCPTRMERDHSLDALPTGSEYMGSSSGAALAPRPPHISQMPKAQAQAAFEPLPEREVSVWDSIIESF